MSVSICIFAHNEERLLANCFNAAVNAAHGLDHEIHILENGSTDGTANVADTLASANPYTTVHHISMADKAGAWNDYVFRLAPTADTHVFCDGDIMASEGSIAALHGALQKNRTAYGAAALPASGRSQREWAKLLLTKNYLSGNLYALSNRALETFRDKEIYFPVGAKGEDGLISYILLTDFAGGTNDIHRENIVVVDDATFEFESLALNARDLWLFDRRLKRYSERHIQKQILYSIL
ncbi:MAG: glycosyltransferase family 2 protein, partial [Marinicaulis sp.]|nr:glycosyltransferase family 2 protein [Marinicaulis sp.]